jgi:hypothetical protein
MGYQNVILNALQAPLLRENVSGNERANAYTTLQWICTAYFRPLTHCTRIEFSTKKDADIKLVLYANLQNTGILQLVRSWGTFLNSVCS